MRASFGIRRYRHEELEGDEVGTAFKNNTTSSSCSATPPLFGRLKGTNGGWVMDRAFSATGEEALSPPIDSNKASRRSCIRSCRGRTSRCSSADASSARRSRRMPQAYLTIATSPTCPDPSGLLLRPAGGQRQVTVALSLARAVRNPALEELYFFGVHPGNFAFEIGNEELDAEKALGFDVSFRWRSRARPAR